MIKIFNTIQIMEDVFNDLYPDAECDVHFVSDLYKDKKIYGQTAFYPIPLVQIEANIGYCWIIETLAHELAHVAAGAEVTKKEDHGEEWRKIYYHIGNEFNKVMECYSLEWPKLYYEWIDKEAGKAG